ncbi:hypothetical protein AEGHOMDF_2544 [Methylobacterium soli]|nr:hypothetical protein AEGHOMDF_2544 [Methylobacterium soli]
MIRPRDRRRAASPEAGLADGALLLRSLVPARGSVRDTSRQAGDACLSTIVQTFTIM